jgi:hypothetical protein
MKRREFIRIAAAVPMLGAAPRLFAATEKPEASWRTFELTYEVDLSAQSGAGKLWLP